MQLVICPYVPSRIWQESFRSLECHLKSTRARDEGGKDGLKYYVQWRERERKRKKGLFVGVEIAHIQYTRTHEYNIHAHTSVRALLRLTR